MEDIDIELPVLPVLCIECSEGSSRPPGNEVG